MPLDTRLDPFAENATPIRLVTPDTWPGVRRSLPVLARAFADAQGFEPKPGRHCLVPDESGGLAAVLLGLDESPGADPFGPGQLATRLPKGAYRFEGELPSPELATLGFVLGSYRFDRYREVAAHPIALVPPEGVDAADVMRMAEAVARGRDLINTPASDLSSEGLERAARDLADRFGATISTIVGDDLLAQNFPMIHAVGRAAAVPPRLVDLAWGDPGAPRVTLVGKGVTFDTGGLDIKPGSAMLLMKKDMGGAATALALAEMIIGAGLSVRLRVLIPAVENSISASSFRPGDILRSRKGISVEIGNTDAEGRLILADALALADEDAPELLVDFSTLTGAARVALGPDLPAVFTEDEALAADLARLGAATNDSVWRLPLWPPYAKMLDSKIADINHVSGGAFAGAITAALFLRRFASAARAHLHVDHYAWVPAPKPGRPEGGEVQTARLLYALLRERYGVQTSTVG